jgi:hypothetical protein
MILLKQMCYGDIKGLLGRRRFLSVWMSVQNVLLSNSNGSESLGH